MKKALSLLLVFCMVLSLGAFSVSAAEYADTEGHWAAAAINRWSGYGIVEGDENGFNPDENMTRAQGAKVFAELMKLTSTAGAQTFSDVPADSWYAPYIALVSAAGIMGGTDDAAKTMEPDAPMTREAFFTMFARALGIEESYVAPGRGDGSGWAAGYIKTLTDKGYVQGDETGVNPYANINRASVMSLMDQTIDAYAAAAGETVKGTTRGMTLVVADNVTVTGSPKDVTIATGGAVRLDSAMVGNTLSVIAPAEIFAEGTTTIPVVNISEKAAAYTGSASSGASDSGYSATVSRAGGAAAVSTLMNTGAAGGNTSQSPINRFANSQGFNAGGHRGVTIRVGSGAKIGRMFSEAPVHATGDGSVGSYTGTGAGAENFSVETPNTEVTTIEVVANADGSTTTTTVETTNDAAGAATETTTTVTTEKTEGNVTSYETEAVVTAATGETLSSSTSEGTITANADGSVTTQDTTVEMDASGAVVSTTESTSTVAETAAGTTVTSAETVTAADGTVTSTESTVTTTANADGSTTTASTETVAVTDATGNTTTTTTETTETVTENADGSTTTATSETVAVTDAAGNTTTTSTETTSTATQNPDGSVTENTTTTATDASGNTTTTSSETTTDLAGTTTEGGYTGPAADDGSGSGSGDNSGDNSDSENQGNENEKQNGNENENQNQGSQTETPSSGGGGTGGGGGGTGGGGGAYEEEPVAVSSVTLSETSVTMAPGTTRTLTATVLPANAANKTVTWGKRDGGSEKITVADGVITVAADATDDDTAVITATADGVTATCAVAVDVSLTPVTGVSLDENTKTIKAGANFDLTATVNPLTASDPSVSWTSSNPAVATVDETGNVVGVYPGTATITVTTTDNNKTATCEVTVQGDIATATITVGNTTYTGATATPTVTVTSANGATLVKDTDFTVTTRDKNAGPGTVTIEGIGDWTGSVTRSFTISPASISGATFALVDENDLTYTGSALTPEISGKVKIGDTELTSGTDYNATLTYENNTNAGQATATITGKGNYTGTASKTFTIKPKTLTKGMISSLADTVYQNAEPTFTVADNAAAAKTSLEAGVDYEVTAYNTATVGADTGTVTLTGKGNYTGTVTDYKYEVTAIAVESVTLDETAKNLELAAEGGTQPSFTLTPTVLPANATTKTVTWQSDNTEVATVADGVVTAVGVGTATITATAEDTTKSAVATCTVTVSKNGATDLSGAVVTLSGNTNLTFTNEAKEPTVESVVLGDNTTLTVDTNYKVTYEDNINAGTAKVVVTGVGEYKGSVETEFTIAKAAITDSMIAGITDQTYTGDQLKPEPKVTFPANTSTGAKALDLVAGTDFTYEYGTNLNVGSGAGTVTIAAKADSVNFKDNTTKAKKTFNITAANIADAEVTVTAQPYTGKAYTTIPDSAVEVKLNGKTLTQGANNDYTFAISETTEGVDNTAAGAAKGEITVTGVGSYADSEKVQTFEITPYDLSSSKVTVEIEGKTIPDQEYKNVPVELSAEALGKVAVYFGLADTDDADAKAAKKLTATSDYTVSYKNNEAVGTAALVLTGKGNFTGTKEIPFNIVAPAVPVTGLTLSGTGIEAVTGQSPASDYTLTLTKGATLTPSVLVTPSNATEKSVTWESDDEEVATVDEEIGLITAVAAGTTTITATTAGKDEDGNAITKTIAVTVTDSLTISAIDLKFDASKDDSEFSVSDEDENADLYGDVTNSNETVGLTTTYTAVIGLADTVPESLTVTFADKNTIDISIAIDGEDDAEPDSITVDNSGKTVTVTYAVQAEAPTVEIKANSELTSGAAALGENLTGLTQVKFEEATPTTTFTLLPSETNAAVSYTHGWTGFSGGYKANGHFVALTMTLSDDAPDEATVTIVGTDTNAPLVSAALDKTGEKVITLILRLDDVMKKTGSNKGKFTITFDWDGPDSTADDSKKATYTIDASKLTLAGPVLSGLSAKIDESDATLDPSFNAATKTYTFYGVSADDLKKAIVVTATFDTEYAVGTDTGGSTTVTLLAADEDFSETSREATVEVKFAAEGIDGTTTYNVIFTTETKPSGA